MLASPDAYTMIKQFESLRLRSYLDQKGVFTVGYGHTGDDVGPGMFITIQDAQRLLEEDVHFVEYALNRMILNPIEQREFDALVSWAFNVGTGAAKTSTLMKFLNFGQTKEAAEELLRWTKITLKNGKKVVNKGLTRRRSLERKYFLTGTMEA